MRNVQVAGIAFGNGRFVAAGGGLTLLTSKDGTNWVCRSDRITNSRANINFATETYNYGGDTLTLAFTDGPLPPRSFFPYHPRSVCFGGGRFLIACDAGWILTSADGESWSVCTTGTSERLCGIASGMSNFVAVGDAGTIRSSADGMHWAQRKSPTASGLRAITFANGLFVAVGHDGAIVTSPDGAAWTLRRRSPSVELGSITYGNGVFMAAGVDGCDAVMTSADGITWRSFTPAGSRLTGVSCANGIFFATGCAGLFAKLQPDAHWASIFDDTPSSRRIDTVVFGNDVYVAAGSGLCTSSDSRSWCWQWAEPSGLMQGYFIGRGWALVGGPEGVLDSTDGVVWTKYDGRAIAGDVSGNVLRTFRTDQRTNVVVLYSKNGIEWRRLSAIDKDSPTVLPEQSTTPTIASAPVALPAPPVTAIRLNGTNYALNLAARSGGVYRLQASTNLEHWVDLTNLTNRGDLLIYMDRDLKNYPMRFYRLLPW